MWNRTQVTYTLLLRDTPADGSESPPVKKIQILIPAGSFYIMFGAARFAVQHDVCMGGNAKDFLRIGFDHAGDICTFTELMRALEPVLTPARRTIEACAH